MVNRLLMAWTLVAACTNLVLADDPPQVLAQGQGANSPKQPQAFVSPDGTVDVVYVVSDEIVVSTSQDSGATFKRAMSAIRCPNVAVGMRRGPRVVRTKTALVVSAIGGKQGKGKDGELFVWHSTDDGKTWSDVVTVNDVPAAAREGLHAMAVGSNGAIWCTWLDLRSGKTEVYVSASSDDGKTWTANSLAYRSPDGSVCECCHPSVIVSNDTVTVMFRNSLAGSRDMYVATSKDEGKSFGSAKKLGQGTWKLNACPMDGGMLASDGKGSLVSAWRRNGEVYTASTGGREQLLGQGEQPWIASTATGPVIVWTAGREGDLIVLSPASKQPQKLAGSARDPMVSSASNGKGPVIACWESKINGQPAVLAARIDLGKSKAR